MGFTSPEGLTDPVPTTRKANSPPLADTPPNQTLLPFDSLPTQGDGHTSFLRSPGSPSHGSVTPAAKPLRSPVSDHKESWSAAIGPATISGKSGRVIERLMGENDRLHRELRLANAKLEEEQRRSESAREAHQSSQEKNATLEIICGTNQAALTRRNRMIEELKTALRVESTLRRKTEAEMRGILQSADETRDIYEKDLAREREIASHVNSQYDTLHEAFQGITSRFNVQRADYQEEIRMLEQRNQSRQQRFEALEVVCSELRERQDKLDKLHQQILELHEGHRKVIEETIGTAAKKAEQNRLACEEISQRMEKAMGEMKYVVNVKRNLKE